MNDRFADECDFCVQDALYWTDMGEKVCRDCFFACEQAQLTAGEDEPTTINENLAMKTIYKYGA